MGVSGLEQDILDRLAAGVHERLGKLSPDQAADIDSAWVADAMLEAIPTEHPFTRLGPFYDTAGLAIWLGISRQALHQKVRAGQILACVTGDGQRVYPAWQFTPDRRTLPGLGSVLPILLANTDPWTAAIWLTTPSDRLNKQTAVSVLRHSYDPDPVVAVATDDAAGWAA